MENKIAFYLDKENLNNQDYSRITEGNPGIGGSEYEFLLVSYLLEQRKNGITSILLTRNKLKFPHSNIQYVKSIDDACNFCLTHNIFLLVINQTQFDKKILDPYGTKLSFILWAHNTMPYSKLSLFSQLTYIKRIVCCGREMLDLYRDHIATLKSTYIYNIFPTKEKDWYLNKISHEDNHNVAYMGCLTPEKGFHVLARAWKDILKKVPDAQLYVIGSGQLYNKMAVGEYGLAEKNYEKYFMSYLKDENGNLLPSVHFMGLMGIEKFEVLAKCKVGVPNPTGKTECLPITTIEMQLMGCKITTIKHPAYLDTVFNSKNLYKKTSELCDFITKSLLSSKDDSYDDVYQFITNKFNTESNIQRWEQMIQNIDTFPLENYSEKPYQMKKIKNLLLQLKLRIPIFNHFPPIEKFYNFFLNRILKYNS